jgi:hypothetical protein
MTAWMRGPLTMSSGKKVVRLDVLVCCVMSSCVFSALVIFILFLPHSCSNALTS